MSEPIDPRVGIGHVHLKVADLEPPLCQQLLAAPAMEGQDFLERRAATGELTPLLNFTVRQHYAQASSSRSAASSRGCIAWLTSRARSR